VLALGGGYMADVDPDQVHRTLDLLERAVELGVPTAMVGQGVGPLEDSELLARARRILPSVDFIALRERCNGPALLKSLDVDDDRVTVTGDDAIEMAYGLRSENVGSGFGVCLRIAPYSPVAGAATEAIRAALHTCAALASASLVPMAVSEYQSEDRRSTLPLTTGYANVVPMLSRHSSARDLARRVSTCRVVVTGAYHLAVFALSQGIPVVAMSSSRYYDHKFIGLRDMFQCGVSTVKLETDSLEQRLSDAILAASAEAPTIRERLLDAAQRQIRTSRAAYDRVYELVEKPERAPEP
jgi:polysaccharide pyruvyl transferase WcaK-like protein